MKVLHVFKSYFPDKIGGIEELIRVLGNNTNPNLRQEVFTLSWANKRPYEVNQYEGLYIHRVKTQLEKASTTFSLYAPYYFSKVVKEFDLVHYHFPWPFMDFMALLGRVKKPSIVTYHSDIIKQKTLLKIYSPLMHWFLGSASAIVATSPKYIESSPILKKFKNKVCCIPVGTELNKDFSFEKEREKYKETLGDNFVLFIGQLRYYKGVKYLIEAAKGQNFKVVIAGAGPDFSEHEAYCRANLMDNVVLLGRVSEAEKYALLSLCKLFVLPSIFRSEAYGLVLVEASMMGKPMITCEIGSGTTYLNCHEKTGLVVPPRNSEAIKEAIQRLYSDEEECREFGLNALSNYQKNLTAEIMRLRYSKLYEEILLRAT